MIWAEFEYNRPKLSQSQRLAYEYEEDWLFEYDDGIVEGELNRLLQEIDNRR